MHLQFATPKTAALLIGRLRETEKIEIRRASPDRLEFLRTHDFLSDGVTPEVMAEVKAKLDADFTEFGKGEFWAAQTWNI